MFTTSIGKKGNWEDFLYLIPMMLVIFFVIAVCGYFLKDFNTNYQDIETINNGSKVMLQESSDRFTPLWDNAFALLFVGIFSATLVSAFFIQSHPIFYIIGLFMQLILIIIAGLFKHIYEEITATGFFSQIISEMNMTSYIFTKYPLFMMIFTLLLGVVLYAKSKD